MAMNDERDAFGDRFDYDQFHYDESGNRYPLSSWYVMRDQWLTVADRWQMADDHD